MQQGHLFDTDDHPDRIDPLRMMTAERELLSLRTQVRQHAHDAHGILCPLCRQLVKAYRRKFNYTMARFLINLAAATQKENRAYHVTEVRGMYRGGEYAYSRHWGMIVPAERDPSEDKHSSGRWVITDYGIRVALNQAPFRSHAVILHNECLQLNGDRMYLDQLLSDPKAAQFSYSELVRQSGLGYPATWDGGARKAFGAP